MKILQVVFSLGFFLMWFTIGFEPACSQDISTLPPVNETQKAYLKSLEFYQDIKQLQSTMDSQELYAKLIAINNNPLLTHNAKEITKEEEQKEEAKLERQVLINLNHLIAKVVQGGTGVFTGTFIGISETNFLKVASPYADTNVRNFLDKTEDFSQPIGQILIGAASFIEGTDGPKISGGVGALLIAVPAVLRLIGLGANEDNVARKFGQLGNPESELYKAIAQISMSRIAYYDINDRQTLLKKYINDGTDLLKRLKSLENRYYALEKKSIEESKKLDEREVEELKSLVDSCLIITTMYTKVAKFFDEYSNQLVNSYDRYAKQFSDFSPTLNSQSEAVKQLQINYRESVEIPYLSQIPFLSEQLLRWRIRFK